MRTIVHLSDLHFGRVDPKIRQPVLEFIVRTRPDAVVISGDFTQRARRREFRWAQDFLRQIAFPLVLVPGNHDLPLNNLFARLFAGLHRYRRFIAADLEPFYLDDEMAIIGVNTARALTWKNGRINAQQIELMRARLQTAGPSRTKIVVTHHPFDLPPGAEGEHVVGRSRLAMRAIAECRADVLLAGHFHIGHTGYTAKRYSKEGYTALIVAAGTSMSTRGRGQVNSHNVIRVDGPRLEVERWGWQAEAAQFAVMSLERFARDESGWQRVEAGAA